MVQRQLTERKGQGIVSIGGPVGHSGQSGRRVERVNMFATAGRRQDAFSTRTITTKCTQLGIYLRNLQFILITVVLQACSA